VAGRQRLFDVSVKKIKKRRGRPHRLKGWAREGKSKLGAGKKRWERREKTGERNLK
jgi:hypothetical protein